MLNTTSNNIINTNSTPSLFSLPKPFLIGACTDTSHVLQLQIPSCVRPFLSSTGPGPARSGRVGPTSLTARTRPRRARNGVRVMAAAVTTIDIEKSVSAKAIVSVKRTIGGTLTNIGFSRGLDDISDLFGKTLLLELVSAELDLKTGMEKETIKGYAHHVKDENGMLTYEAKFEVPPYFGEVGAVLVENEHHKEMYLADIVLDGLPLGSLRFSCNSWVHSKFNYPEKRIFFSNKSYLPSQTPSGLKRLRERELENLRGDGQGERKPFERMYDYDTYNDLGNPDKNHDLARPVLGGQDLPYPRRCKTGRHRCKTDPLSESRSSSVYVPRDEQFAEVKQATFSAKTVYSVLHAIVPSLDAVMVDSESPFPYFTAIDLLFHEGLKVPGFKQHTGLINVLPRLVKALNNIDDVLRFEPPGIFDRDRFSWFRDEEFSRQTLAGLNPCSIKLVTEWPLISKLDPEIYGPPESAITKELVESAIGGLMTLEEAIEKKKLFMLDYHDAYLPYVNKVRELKGTTLYGSRTLFFLTPEDSVLRPLAIELTRPPIDDKPQWKQVFTPGWDGTSCWLWRLAKAHVLAHDSGYHQLISHWLRTHCCVEPYIIAANRHLSAMHPIYRLLHPHFRYTMEINALARLALINAGGIIESTFSPGKYSIELSSVLYGLEWQFDHQSLPGDLLSRGMATEDPSSPHGLKLSIEDYPFANDGLVLWDSIKQWVIDYIKHYYPNQTLIESDQELQAWWTEIRTVGHGDKKDEPWWPNLKTTQDLVQILTTMIWTTSGLHAAVNFGQYAYAGYFPNRPTITRANMPTENPSEDEWKFFSEKPEQVLLKSFPSQLQATKVMTILDVLSNHSPDEEYLGEKPEPAWEDDPILFAAFEKFQGRLKELEGIIDERNANSDLKNRNGAGVVPYELLKPFSQPGVTSMGVPNSISI